MQLHQLQRSPQQKKAHRVGRGGKRGTTSGRGQKGQKSRAGRRIRPAIRDLIIRVPKHRGFRNKSMKPKPLAVNVITLARIVKRAATAGKLFTVDAAALESLGIIRNRRHAGVKVLGRGPVDVAMVVKGISMSASARAAIEKAGGKVIANNANSEG